MYKGFSISTVAYAGYDIEQALDSIASLGVSNIELALIQGAVYDLDEDTLCEEYVSHIKALLDARRMSCTSLAAHCPISIDDCGELLAKRVRLTHLLECPRLILYAPRDGSLSQFKRAAEAAIAMAKHYQIKILIENVGDQQPYMLNDSRDFDAVAAEFDSATLGINFDPGNLASHRPNNNLLYDSIKSLDVAEHIHIKDLVVEQGDYQFCAIGEGICQYPALLRHASEVNKLPFFSIEAPFALVRRANGKAELKPRQQLLPISEIESRLKLSLHTINQNLHFGKAPETAVLYKH